MSKVKNVEYGLEKIFAGAQDFLPLLGTDYVEFYVGNAKKKSVRQCVQCQSSRCQFSFHYNKHCTLLVVKELVY